MCLSKYSEFSATEIQVQGLVDYACILWDADMRYSNGQWQYYKFNGRNKGTEENNEENRKYMLNAYRVLLTRARQYLSSLGITELRDDEDRLNVL